MILSDAPRRLGIFFFFDAQGVVDSYVEAMLTDMKNNVEEIVTVVNGEVSAKSYARLAAHSARVILRENQGLDVWAYKTAMESYGWDRLTEFDELVLFNATIMGPVYPLAEMFDEMARRDIDFWGVTWFHQVDFDPFGTMPDGYIPRHLQSHFHVYRQSLVRSPEFQKYWDEIGPIRNYIESVGLHEAPFTQRFERLGFVSDVYVNTEDLDGFTYQPILFCAKELVANRRCPIFKRRSFFHDYEDVLNQAGGQDARELYDYLRDYTDFDTNLIWDNVTRSMNMIDVMDNLNLTYVLPAETVLPRHGSEAEPAAIALVAHLYYMDLLDDLIKSICTMPHGCDVYVTVDSKEKVALVRQAVKELPYRVDVRLIENRGRDVSALLVGVKDVIMDYELVCFVHDKKVTQLTPYSKGSAFADKCFQNLLASPQFVENVVATFATEPRLGMLMPTPPNHAEYFPIYSFGWGENFVKTRNLLEEMNIRVPLDPEKAPVAPLGTMFWFRPKALKPLFDLDWQWQDFPPEPNKIDGTVLHAIERAYGYSAQGMGYFSAWLFSDRFARTELTNLAFYTREMTRAIAKHWNADTERNMVYDVRQFRGIRRRIKDAVRPWVPTGLRGPARSILWAMRGVRK
ncbi:MAG: rhamnan synthesis F family protein [Actinomyces urogenitalis]|uniref:rhamnan synthesis F family protein n=1 Tax=Actinomyces urogenitalis TaxID=103621 RepID=UPI000510307E|nr:rhamnan synthesis F family protein [Actinomyces urogenitalis]KGF01252.1 rhamnan synthesis protein F [Actinomyces urogenitalis S6-C4]MDU5875330.1 rhamnan synthesis F family protein [Actinomyces urogenitalis]